MREENRFGFVEEYNVRELADLLESIGEEIERRRGALLGAGVIALARMLRGESPALLHRPRPAVTENPHRTPSLVDLVRPRPTPDASPQ